MSLGQPWLNPFRVTLMSWTAAAGGNPPALIDAG